MVAICTNYWTLARILFKESFCSDALMENCIWNSTRNQIPSSASKIVSRRWCHAWTRNNASEEEVGHVSTTHSRHSKIISNNMPCVGHHSKKTYFLEIFFRRIFGFIYLCLATKMIILRTTWRRYFFFDISFLFFSFLPSNEIYHEYRSFDVTYIFRCSGSLSWKVILVEDLVKTGEAFGSFWYSLIHFYAKSFIDYSFRL